MRTLAVLAVASITRRSSRASRARGRYYCLRLHGRRINLRSLDGSISDEWKCRASPAAEPAHATCQTPHLGTPVIQVPRRPGSDRACVSQLSSIELAERSHGWSAREQKIKVV